MDKKQGKRYRRHKRVRAKIFGMANRPRLCVFRSNKHIYAQLIDDEKGKTLTEASDLELKKSVSHRSKVLVEEVKGSKQKEQKTKEEAKNPLSGKAANAYEVGRLIAKKSLEKKIEKVVFDRGGYKYHGRVKALAEGAREEGLKF